MGSGSKMQNHNGRGRVLDLAAARLLGQAQKPTVPPELELMHVLTRFKAQVDSEEKEARELLEQLDQKRAGCDQEQLRELERYHALCTKVQGELAILHLAALTKVSPNVGASIEASLEKVKKLFSTEKPEPETSTEGSAP